MGLIMNASSNTQKTKVFGNYFEFKPGQIKMMDDKISHFIAIERKGLGLVAIDKKYEDLEYRESKEGKQGLAEARAQGIAQRIAALKDIIHNEEVSLTQDLEKAGLASKTNAWKSPAYEVALEEVLSYQQKEEDLEKKREERILELKKKLQA